MVNIMNKKEFDNWVGKVLEWKPKHYGCWVVPDTNIAICVNEKNGKVGVARCHPDDKFVLSYGRAIAIARCAGKEVPTFTTYKKMNELKNGDTFKKLGHIYRYIGKISENNHAVVDILSGRLEKNYNKDEEEVEIC